MTRAAIAPKFRSPAARLKSLAGEVTEVRKFEVECGFCTGFDSYEAEEIGVTTKVEMAKELLRRGWRYIVLGDSEGWGCEECVAEAESGQVLDIPEGV